MRRTTSLQQQLPLLSLKARRVLELRFGLGNEPCYTMTEVGTRLGVSACRVRQLERQALMQLRRALVAGDKKTGTRKMPVRPS